MANPMARQIRTIIGPLRKNFFVIATTELKPFSAPFCHSEPRLVGAKNLDPSARAQGDKTDGIRL
jgi:hypothetical protein